MAIHLFVGSSDQPLHDRLEIRLLLGADAIAADFSVGDGFQVHLFDEVVD